MAHSESVKQGAADKDSPPLKDFRVGYVGSGALEKDGHHKLPLYKSVPQALITHNTVAARARRPDETVGGVYSRKDGAVSLDEVFEARTFNKVAELSLARFGGATTCVLVTE